MKDYRIVVGKTAPHGVFFAARQLQKYLSRIAGRTFPVLTDGAEPANGEICLGITNRSDAGIPDNPEGYHVFSENGRTFIMGGSEPGGRGVIYGVYAFLEGLGCGFYAEDTEIVPVLGEEFDPASVGRLESAPAFEYRDLFWSCSYDPELSTKLRLNGCLVTGRNLGRKIPADMGGGIRYAGPHFVHTFDFLVPPSEYFAEHPEYFSEIDGKRTCEHLYSQLCLTNEDVYRIVLKKVKDWLRQYPDCRIVSVSQNDSYYPKPTFCTCEKCRKVNEEEKSLGGTLFRFVNRIAADLETEYPRVSVDTLAYQYSVTPPALTVPRKNVIIRYCTGSCGFHPIEDGCETNAVHKQNLERWKVICNRIYVWDYTTNFAQYLSPYPNFQTLASNLRFFKNNGVSGVFEQGQYQEGLSGEFGELRSFVLAKLLWNPGSDTEKLMREFCAAYYGPAAGCIQKFINMIRDRFPGDGKHLPFGTDFAANYEGCLSDADFRELSRLWEDAKMLTEGKELFRRHVLRSELCFRFIKANMGVLEFSGENGKQELKKWKKDALSMGVLRYNESLLMEDFLSDEG